MERNRLLAALRRLYQDIDAEARELVDKHASRLQCRRGCKDCCVDGLTVFEIEAENIRQNHKELLLTSQPHGLGGCAFLDSEGACRIYENRPYVCRTQGLPLRWLEERDSILRELRDICELNEEGTPIEELPTEDCWTLGPAEEALAELQRMLDGGKGRRVSLRGLFQV